MQALVVFVKRSEYKYSRKRIKEKKGEKGKRFMINLVCYHCFNTTIYQLLWESPQRTEICLFSIISQAWIVVVWRAQCLAIFQRARVETWTVGRLEEAAASLDSQNPQKISSRLLEIGYKISWWLNLLSHVVECVLWDSCSL